MSKNQEKLEEHILTLSTASDFDFAKKEWNLTRIEFRKGFDHCPCGQRIKELCYITNQNNGNETYVGNVCINKFIGIDTGNIFDGLKIIEKDNAANPNEDLIKYAYEKDLISNKEYRFLMDTKRKRSLSEKQLKWKVDINQRILDKTVA